MNPNAHLPAPGGAGMLQYLLGMGPMPPPRPQDYAVAHLNAALDGGAFEQPWNHAHFPIPGPAAQPALGPQLPVNIPGQQVIVHNAPAAPSRRLDVHVPYGCGNRKKDDPPMMTILSIEIDTISCEDFLSRVCATIGVEREKAKLGWKSCDDKKKAHYKRLETHDDVKHAFGDLGKLLDSKRREKPVFMMIEHVEKPEEAAKTAPKPTELATDPDTLEKVKTKLKCATHPGPHRWCYVRRDAGHEGEHVALGIAEVGLWARMIADKKANEDCITPPNVLNLDHLSDKTKTRIESGGSRNNKGVNVHIHFDNNTLQPRNVGEKEGQAHLQDRLVPEGAVGQAGAKRAHSPDAEDNSDDEEGLKPISVEEILQHLHEVMPAFNFPQYEAKLLANGICYAIGVGDFDWKYYVEKVGMADGAAREFVRSVKKMLAKQKKEVTRLKKKAKENQPLAA